jgi:hypothetical protein
MDDAPDPKRLEDLDKAIAEVKEELKDMDPVKADERTFLDDGSSPDSEVDNTIVPPG